MDIFAQQHSLFPEKQALGKTLVLRGYQREAKEGLREYLRQGYRRIILCAPTGAGKTVMAADLIRSATEQNRGRRSLFIADRVALVHQASQKMWEYGIPHGVIQGSNTYGSDEPNLVCSAQTLESREVWPDADLVVIDEAHTIRKEVVRRAKLLGVPVIGLTATPLSHGLGLHYEVIVNVRSTNELVADGHLVPMRGYVARAQASMKGVGSPKGPGGEYTDQQAADGAADIVCDIPTEWIDKCSDHFGGPVKSLFFVPTVAYGKELEEHFQNMGHDIRQVSYHRTPQENSDSIRALREGECMGLISVEALVKGLDITDVRYVAMARRYRKSTLSVIQLLGRGMRAHEGKEYFVCCDHAGNLERHGDDVELFWEAGCDHLDMGERKKAQAVPQRDESRTCQQCGFRMPREVRVCPMCGAANEARKARVTAAQGRMEQYRPFREIAPSGLWPHVSQLAVEKHPHDSERARRFAVGQFKGLTGRFPPRSRPLEPNGSCDPVVRSQAEKNFRKWLNRKRREGYAKRKEKELANVV